MDKKDKVKQYKQEVKELNDKLNVWDFLGVVDQDNQDKYNDLINPILNNLRKGTTQRKLSEIIVNFVTERYEITPSGTYDVSEVIIKWWNRN